VTAPEFDRLEHVIGRLLSVGVVLCSAILAIGLVLSFLQSPFANVVIGTGLVVLIATPVARILASLIDATRRRDTLLVWATLIVLSIMAITTLYSLSASKG
jgi:uncharacterized membrane protein